MRYPTITKHNMRYRGPMESEKYNKKNKDFEHDMDYLFKKLAALKQETHAVFADIYQGGNEMSAQCSVIRKQEEYLRGGESRV